MDPLLESSHFSCGLRRREAPCRLQKCMVKLLRSIVRSLCCAPLPREFEFPVLLAVDSRETFMEKDRMEVWMTEYSNGNYKMTWRLKSTPTAKKQGRLLTYSGILGDYPTCCRAVDIAHGELNPAVSLQTLHMVAAVNLAETVMKRKRHLVYTYLAWACNFTSRTELLASVVDAIRTEWSEPGESFVGFLDG